MNRTGPVWLIVAALLVSVPSLSAAAKGPAPEALDPPEPARRSAEAAPSDTAPAAALGRENAAVPPKRRDAQSVTQDGTFLPGTFAARIGDQRISAFTFGGYDSNASQGGVFTSVVEGAIVNRVAIRVGYDYLQSQSGGSVTAGLRFGILRQELNGIDLGVLIQYKQKGFYQSNGEIELALAGSRRWNRFGLYANLVYGQGFERQERDGEVRLSGLYTIGSRYNVGLEARSHFDLGGSIGSPLPGSPPEAAFDMVAGPMASVSLGPVALIAEVGAHAIVIDDNGPSGGTSAGAIALLGAGAAF